MSFFGTLMTTVTFFPANSHVEAVSGGTGVRPFQLGVESNLNAVRVLLENLAKIADNNNCRETFI